MRILLSAILVLVMSAFGMGCSDGDAGGPVVPCATRFCACSDGVTVEDTATGLLWERKTTTGDVHDVTNTYSWSSSPAGSAADGTAYSVFLADLNTSPGFAGHTDWRLPIISELQSILVGLGVDTVAIAEPADPASGQNAAGQATTCGGPPCIDSGFSIVGGPTGWGLHPRSVNHWSASSFASAPDFAWDAGFGNGLLGGNSKTEVNFVRAVRAGSCSS